MFWVALILYVLIGLVAGFLGGLLGIGGGLVAVPALILIFSQLAFPPQYIAQLAIGTSLGAMVFTAAASAYAHYVREGIVWHYFRGLAPGIILGCVSSALIAGRLSSRTLEIIFGLSVCVMGLYFCFGTYSLKEGHNKKTGIALLAVLGILIGAFSTILGIGGGIVTVPALTGFRVPMKNAIATSAATGFLIAVFGALSFLFVGMHEHLVEGSLGFLYFPAFIPIGLAALVTAPLGARYAYILPAYHLRKLFGIFLLIAGAAMLF